MKILLVSSEVFPYAKTGGLADMAGALAAALAADGHDVSVFTPLYRVSRDKVPRFGDTGIHFKLPLAERTVAAQLRVVQPAPRLRIFFLDQPDLYDRPGIYGESGRDYPDSAARFIYFSKCAVDLARNIEPFEIVHGHDWQAGLVPLMIRYQERQTGWRNAPATVTTIHNLAYQGLFPAWDYALTNLPAEYLKPDGLEFYGQMNCLKAGLVFADFLTTVSPRYASEITTPEYGCGLEGVLLARQDRLKGILNGVDYAEWNTDKNPRLKVHYSSEDLSGKAALKRALQEEFGLPAADSIPLFGTVGRLAEQKGVPIQITALEEMLSTGLQFVLLGSGDPEYERAFLQLAQRYPDKVAVRIGYDHNLAHRIEAGCDFFIMPSRFEPCGLNQMYSLRYGTVPIVRATGGLDDSVVDITEDQAFANGIKFGEYSPQALAKAIRKALVIFQDQELLAHYRGNGMQADFSWENTTHEYVQVFRRALEHKRRG